MSTSAICASKCIHFVHQCNCADQCDKFACLCEQRNDRGDDAPPTAEDRANLLLQMCELAESLLEIDENEWDIQQLMKWVRSELDFYDLWLLNEQQLLSFALAALCKQLWTQHSLLQLIVDLRSFRTGKNACVAVSPVQRRWCLCIECRCLRDQHLKPFLLQVEKNLVDVQAMAHQWMQADANLTLLQEFVETVKTSIESSQNNQYIDQGQLATLLSVLAIGAVLPEFDQCLSEALQIE